jgi:hypothetical protein
MIKCIKSIKEKRIEKEIYQIYQTDMENVDKESLLVAYAIGKNGLEFWTSYADGRNKPRLKNANENFDFLDWWEENVMPAIAGVVPCGAAGALEESARSGITNWIWPLCLYFNN